ncbi:MAG TPA: hypothetical protein VMN79_03070 [Casimicrobiaceae bacterium]|nr:hypothetical protein [Casimicrobiaceae bacterium]
MKHSSATAIIAASMLAIAGVDAQTPTPPPTAAAATDAPAPSKAPARTRDGPGTPADARVCLEFPTNAQIIQCAEKYRHMKTRA